MKIPVCYGWLFDEQHMHCQACLIQDDCSTATSKPKKPIGGHATDHDVVIPKNKKRLVLAVCRKYGIATTYDSRKDHRTYDITEENIEEFSNLDFLLTAKQALVTLLQAKVEH